MAGELVASFVVESSNGIGHLSRCAALADALRCLGVRSRWACEPKPAVQKATEGDSPVATA